MSANALYSDSAEDLDIVVCFLEVHEIKLLPRKIVYPNVDQLVAGQPAQSASEKVEMLILHDELMLRQKRRVPLTYLRIILTA